MTALFLLLPILIPFIAALGLASMRPRSRTRLALVAGTVATANTLFTLLIVRNAPADTLTLLRLSPRLSFALHLDGLGATFAVIVALLWVPTTLYALEYMKHEGREKAFFAWFTLTYGVVLGIAFSANLLTLYFFYELMTLTTLPLVMHAMDDRARAAGKKYLTYSVGGASCAFVVLVFTALHGAGAPFAMGGNLDDTVLAVPRNTLLTLYFLGFLGFGVKAAVFPFHGWLPAASVAPTPVTALLHAVAVVKGGVFAIIRLTHFVFGPGLLLGSWAQTAALALVCFTIVYGSAKALASQHLKLRFAYSTVAQLSYILLGAILLTPEGLVGSLTHMAGHALMKINLFFCAGAILYKTHREYLYDMRGIGVGMPKTLLCLAVSGMALAGLPPLAGFVGKWQIGTAAATAPYGYIGIAALMLSALLTVLYIFSVLGIATMPGRNFDFETANRGVEDPNILMTGPMFTLAIAAILYGLYSESVLRFFGRIAAGLL
ncbi:MAG: proton-conducting transporter membrane subunit [Fretibacterium sp.]|nr:proton-conducting transporter membrane subunit [Fretibacterium sp.]